MTRELGTRNVEPTQLALFEDPKPVIEASNEPRAFLLRIIPDCVCDAERHVHGSVSVSDHRKAGCQQCDCRATHYPPESVELHYEVDFDDGCGAWVDLDSHHWMGIPGENRIGPLVVGQGAVSSTGYRSMYQGFVDGEPAEGWYTWGMMLAARAHCDWHAEQAKGRRR